MANNDGSVLERHYTPQELAEAWQLHERTIRQIFKNEPGVINVANQRPGRRRHSTLRISETAVLRVMRRLQVAPPHPKG